MFWVYKKVGIATYYLKFLSGNGSNIFWAYNEFNMISD